MTLDTIINRYEAGTLAEESDLILLDAQAKITVWRNWRISNPEAKPEAVPSAAVLESVQNFIQSTTNRRYGCND